MLLAVQNLSQTRKRLKELSFAGWTSGVLAAGYMKMSRRETVAAERADFMLTL